MSDYNESANRYVIEIQEGWSVNRLINGDAGPIRLARVYQPKGTWPTKREKPVIILGPSDSDVDIGEQIRLWFLGGCKTAEEIKEEGVYGKN